MSELLDCRGDRDKSAGEIMSLEPGEPIIWAGRAIPARIFRQSVSKGLFGLFFVGFTLVWICAVVHGGHNNWDRGRVVRPFATHNVLIAAGAGLWLLPPGFYMLSWPLRAWWKARNTGYAVTDRRALIVGSGFAAVARSSAFCASGSLSSGAKSTPTVPGTSSSRTARAGSGGPRRSASWRSSTCGRLRATCGG